MKLIIKLKINKKIYLVIKEQKINYINPSIKKNLIVTKEEVENSFKEASKDKAVSQNLIPNKCLKELFKSQKENSLLYKKLPNIFNRYIKFNARPKKITTFMTSLFK